MNILIRGSITKATKGKAPGSSISEEEAKDLDKKITLILEYENQGLSDLTDVDILTTQVNYKTVPFNSEASLSMYQKGLRHKEFRLADRKCIFLLETHLSRDLTEKYIENYPVNELLNSINLMIQYYFDERPKIELMGVKGQRTSGYTMGSQIINQIMDYGVYILISMNPREYKRDLELFITHTFREIDDKWIESLTK